MKTAIKAALLVLVAITLSACSSWEGQAEITTKKGTVIQCPKGLIFGSNGIRCLGSKDAIGALDDILIMWENVAGFRTK